MSDMDWQPADETQDLRPHLPECPATNCGCGKEEECGPRCIHTCICPYLHACEERVRSAELAEAKALLASRDEAWYSGVQAARDAVAALQSMTGLLGKDDALAAIDALREKP